MKRVKSKIERFGKSPEAEYIREFGQATTLHGLSYIVRKNYHYTETLLWLMSVVLATFGSSKLIYDSWNRYNSNPTVVSLEKDFREWNITFPAVTVCFTNRLNETRAVNFIREVWNTDQNSSKFDKYFKFLLATTNLNYDNLEDFKEFTEDSDLKLLTGQQLSEIALQNNADMSYNAVIFDPAYSHLALRETLTEMGICHTYSGVVSYYHTLRQKPLPSREIPYCNYLAPPCYGRIESLPRSVRYYIHSPYELPAWNDKSYEATDNTERDTTWKFSEMVASPELRRLEPRQRQCRFVDEPLEGERVYSYNLCKMGCRKRMAHRLCGCAPFFYRLTSDISDDIPVCDVRGLSCVSDFKVDIMKAECKCLSQCEYVIFLIDENIKKTWKYPMPPDIRIKWGIVRYSKTRQKRDIIFGFEDLLISFGGTAALFLGCSVLSFVEVGYFFSLRLFWHIARRCRPEKRSDSENAGGAPSTETHDVELLCI